MSQTAFVPASEETGARNSHSKNLLQHRFVVLFAIMINISKPIRNHRNETMLPMIRIAGYNESLDGLFVSDLDFVSVEI